MGSRVTPATAGVVAKGDSLTVPTSWEAYGGPNSPPPAKVATGYPNVFTGVRPAPVKGEDANSWSFFAPDRVEVPPVAGVIRATKSSVSVAPTGDSLGVISILIVGLSPRVGDLAGGKPKRCRIQCCFLPLYRARGACLLGGRGRNLRVVTRCQGGRGSGRHPRGTYPSRGAYHGNGTRLKAKGTR